MDFRSKARQACVAVTAIVLSCAAGTTAQAQSSSDGWGAAADSGGVKRAGFLKRWTSRSCDQCCPPATIEERLVTPSPTTTPAPEAPQEAAPSESADAMASALDTAGSPQTMAPNMLGDFIGSSSSSFIVASRTITRFKVADNTSPLPRGRVFYNFNYFQDAFSTTTDIYRNLGGAEIPFLGNVVSFEIRDSLNTFAGVPGPNQTQGGALVTTLKAVGYDADGLVLSGGLGVGWPVGPYPEGYPGGNAIFAPFLGYVFVPAGTDFFIQGFQQIDVPSASEDQILMHTDIAGGYWLRRGDNSRFITGIAPTIEMHLYTPLGNPPSGSLAGVIYDDVLNATIGTTFVLANRASLAVGLGVPLSTRKDYDIEAQVQFNWFYGAGR